MMIFNDLCLKIIFWPVLSQLAGLKGLCPYYNILPPVVPTIIISNTTLIPTTTTILPPCPTFPLVCFTGGIRPIPYCPCIDPRLQNVQNTNSINWNPIVLALPNNGPSDTMIFSQLDRKRRKKRET